MTRYAGGDGAASAGRAKRAAPAGKDGLSVLGERPFNAETPPHLLDADVTPTSRHFVRDNGLPPENTGAANWRLRIDGLVHAPLTLGVEDLARRFEVVTRRLVIECAGNGRAFFDPPTPGACQRPLDGADDAGAAPEWRQAGA